MTTLESAITGLCLAIDEGDDTLLPILADALEDADDPRAAGLREIIRLRKRPPKFQLPGGAVAFGWQNGSGHEWSVGGECWSRLRMSWDHIWGDWLIWWTRSAAFLALAAALADPTKEQP